MKARAPGRARQSGMAGAILVALLVLCGALLAFNTFSLTTVQVDRDRVTNEALARAKDALIAYAVADTTRPGELPCPDVNDDGKLTLGEDIVGSACVSLIGRLPWSTLGLPDLRDDAGERLWYALSNDFHANGSVALNSDTAYRSTAVSLSIAGTTPAASLVAIVFSPGVALTRADGVVQTRGCTVGTECDAAFKCTATPLSNAPRCNPLNYLDLASGEDNANLANRIFVAAPRSGSFNDRLMPVHSDDIMQLVERRAARELAQNLRNHYNAWQSSTVVSGTGNGYYPFAVPWNDPASTPASLGTNNTTAGLLPLSTTAPTWSNVTPIVCSGNGTTTLHCESPIVCAFGVCLPNLSGRINNVHTRFLDPPSAANVTVTGLSLGGSATWTLNKTNRRLEFEFGGFVSAGTVVIDVTAPAVSSWVGGWLGDNNWHQNAYYAFSPEFAIDGADACGGAAPACFTVTNTGAANDDNHAVVVITGRALSGAGQVARPVTPLPADFGQYFEGLNAGVATVFEANRRTAGFNDTAVGVKP